MDKISKVVSMIKRTEERLPKMKALAENFQDLMAASDSQVRIYNLNTLPTPPYMKDIVYLKLVSVRNQIVKGLAVGIDKWREKFYAGYFSKDFLDKLGLKLARRKMGSAEYGVLERISETDLRDLLMRNANRVSEDTIEEGKHKFIEYPEFERRIFSTIREELFKPCN